MIVESRSVARETPRLISWHNAALPTSIEDERKPFAEQVGGYSLETDVVGAP